MDIHKCAAKNVGFMVARLIHKSLSQSYDFDAFVLAFVLRSYPFLHKSLDEMDEYEMRSYSRSYSFYINPCAKTIFLRSRGVSAGRRLGIGLLSAACLARLVWQSLPGKACWAELAWQGLLGRACLAGLAWQGLLGNWFGIGSASCIVVLWLQNYTIC